MPAYKLITNTKQKSKSLHFQEYFEQLILLSNHVIISVCQATQTYRTCQETQMVSQVVVEVIPLILTRLTLIQSKPVLQQLAYRSQLTAAKCINIEWLNMTFHCYPKK